MSEDEAKIQNLKIKLAVLAMVLGTAGFALLINKLDTIINLLMCYN